MIEFEKPNIECVETDDKRNYAKFICEPLERGYGMTIGNSLRRILLSSLPGAAITSVKINGVVHEFSTVQGVVDSVKEVVDNEGEPTGELRVELLTVGFGERITRVPMYVTNKEGIKYIENNWNPGDLVTAYGEIVYEQRVTEVVQETAFGTGNTKKYTDVIKRLVINSGTSPKTEDEHFYNRNKLLSLRAAALKDIEERYLANKGMSSNNNSGNPYLDF